MKTVLKKNGSFVIPFFLFIVFGFILLSVVEKKQIHLFFNQYHNQFFDHFFFYLTYLGDGILPVLVVIILLVVKIKHALFVAISNLFSALITQYLKRNIFDDVVRPKKFFEGIHDLYFVPGVEYHLFYSFPSGHATTAFALYFSLALITNNAILKLLLFFLALIVAFSRVYLSQHFFSDIYAGSLIGFFITLIAFHFIEKNENKWLNKSLIKILK